MEDIAGKLAEKLTVAGKKNFNRDTASIGLKEVIREIGSGHPMAPVVARVVTPKMLVGLQSTVRGRTTHSNLAGILALSGWLTDVSSRVSQ